MFKYSSGKSTLEVPTLSLRRRTQFLTYKFTAQNFQRQSTHPISKLKFKNKLVLPKKV
jgi:hypothetical protein